MKKVKFLIPAFALAALAFAGCSDDDGGDDQPTVTKLALADPAQAALTFVATSPEAQFIALDTDASAVTVEQVLAEGESKAEWCVVTVQSATQIKVAPANNTGVAERTAKYRISAGTVTPVEFTVTQDFPEPVDATLSIDLEDNWGYSFTAPAAGGDVTVTTVTTNAHLWTAEFCDFMGDPITDEEELPTFCSLKTTSGINGDALIVNFLPNTESMMRYAQVRISAGNAEPIVITLNQDVPLATSATVYDANWTSELTSPYAVAFTKEGGDYQTGYDGKPVWKWEKQEFGIEANGSCSVKVVAEGTTTEATDAWVESYYGTGTWTISVTSENTTGAARKLDVILVGENDKELFRMKVTQAGA